LFKPKKIFLRKNPDYNHIPLWGGIWKFQSQKSILIGITTHTKGISKKSKIKDRGDDVENPRSPRNPNIGVWPNEKITKSKSKQIRMLH
jgi:hypothetical protein